MGMDEILSPQDVVEAVDAYQWLEKERQKMAKAGPILHALQNAENSLVVARRELSAARADKEQVERDAKETRERALADAERMRAGSNAERKRASDEVALLANDRDRVAAELAEVEAKLRERREDLKRVTDALEALGRRGD